jgi:hypothetical protein
MQRPFRAISPKRKKCVKPAAVGFQEETQVGPLWETVVIAAKVLRLAMKKHYRKT